MRRNGVQHCARLLVMSLALCLLTATPAPASDSTSTSAGSGFIITADGYILTNEHVVGDSETVTVYVGNNPYAATVVTKSVESDLALLKIPASGLTPVALGNSLFVQLLDDVVALGFPLPQFGRDLTVSEGRITSFRTNVEGREGRDTLQHDAVITHGSSGGPLFNLKGEVIGVNFAGVEGSGMQLAIPINEAVPLLRSISSFNPNGMGSATQMLSAQDVVARCRESIVYVEVVTTVNWQELLPAPNAVAGFPKERVSQPEDWEDWLLSLGFEVVGSAGLRGDQITILDEGVGCYNDVVLLAFSRSDSASRALGLLLDQSPPPLIPISESRTRSEGVLAEGSSPVGGLSVKYQLRYGVGSFSISPQPGSGTWLDRADISGTMVFALGTVAVRVHVGCGITSAIPQGLSWRDDCVVSSSGGRLIDAEEVLRRLEEFTRLLAVTVTNKLSGR